MKKSELAKLTPVTQASYKKLRRYAVADYVTEYLPVSAAIIYGIATNPSSIAWLIFVIVGVAIIAGMVYMFSKHTKTIIWGLLFILTFLLNGVTIIIVISTCFVFAILNDLWLSRIHNKLKNEYQSNKNTESFLKANGLIK